MVFLIFGTTMIPTLSRGKGKGGPKRAVARSVVYTSYIHHGYRPTYGFGYRGAYFPRISGNAGRVDFNIKPKESQVYVDGAYIGIADDYNGGFFGNTASLKAGVHNIKLVSPDGRIKKEKIYVMPGREIDFDYRF